MGIFDDVNEGADEFKSSLEQSQEFLNDIVSTSSQLTDQLQAQYALIQDKTSLDKEALGAGKASAKVLQGLSAEYSGIKAIQQDRVKIDKQIQKNTSIIGALNKQISTEQKKAAAEYLQKDKALKAETDSLEELISKEEKIAAQVKKRKDLGLDTTAEEAQLAAAERARGLQQDQVNLLQDETDALKDQAGPEAITASLLEQQNAELKQANLYLDEQEAKQNNINKALSIANATLGAASGILNTIGASGVAEGLGLSAGMEAAAEKAKELSEDGEKSVGVFGKMRVAAAGFGAALKSALGPLALLGGLVKIFRSGEQAIYRSSEAAVSFSKELGVSVSVGKEMYKTSADIAGEIGAFAENVQKNTAALQKQLGTTQNFGKETLKTFNLLVEKGGYSVESAAQFTKMASLTKKPLEETTAEMIGQIEAMKAQEGVALDTKSAMEAIGKASSATRLTLGNSAKNMANAAFQAKKLGLELDQVSSIGNSLLDFESSLQKEMEAELLIGRDINLERARAAALEGDLATVAKEVADQIGSAEEFTKMNVMQQQALADSVGMTRDELASALEQQQLLAGTDFKDMNSAQERFNELVKSGMSIEEAKKKIGNAALADQLAAVTYAEEQELRQRSIQDSFAKVAQALLPLVDTFRDLAVKLAPLLATVVTQLIGKLQPILDVVIMLANKFFEMSTTIMGPITNIIDKLFVALTPILDIVTTIVGEVGGALMDAFTVVVDIVSDILDVLAPVLEKVGQLAKDLLPPIKNLFESLKEPIQKIGEVLADAVIAAFEAIVPILETVINIIGQVLPPLIDAILPIVEAVVVVFSEIAEAVLPVIAQLFRDLVPMITNLFDAISPIIDELLGVIIEDILPVFTQMLVALVPIVSKIIEAAMPLVDVFIELVKKLLPSVVRIIEAILPALMPFVELISTLVDAILPVATDLFMLMAGIIEDLLPLLEPFIGLIENVLVPLIEFVTNLLSGNFEAAFENVTEIWSGLVTFFSDLFSSIWGVVSSIFTRIGNFLVDTFSGAIDKVKSFFSAAFDFIKNVFAPIADFFANIFKAPINLAIGIINGLIDAINEALTFNITNPITGTEYSIGVNIPQIPQLAEGGIVDSATMAVIGEAGPEAVIPLDKLSSVVDAPSQNSSESVEELKQELTAMRETMTQFINQTSQLLNRPVVLELDGNKVGQTLGQNSYRIQ